VFLTILIVGTPGLCDDSVMILIYNIKKKNHKERLMARTVLYVLTVVNILDVVTGGYGEGKVFTEVG
jgi:hypothetical protein